MRSWCNRMRGVFSHASNCLKARPSGSKLKNCNHCFVSLFEMGWWIHLPLTWNKHTQWGNVLSCCQVNPSAGRLWSRWIFEFWTCFSSFLEGPAEPWSQIEHRWARGISWQQTGNGRRANCLLWQWVTGGSMDPFVVYVNFRIDVNFRIFVTFEMP